MGFSIRTYNCYNLGHNCRQYSKYLMAIIFKISYWKWPLIVDFPIKNGDFPRFFSLEINHRWFRKRRGWDMPKPSIPSWWSLGTWWTCGHWNTSTGWFFIYIYTVCIICIHIYIYMYYNYIYTYIYICISLHITSMRVSKPVLNVKEL